MKNLEPEVVKESEVVKGYVYFGPNGCGPITEKTIAIFEIPADSLFSTPVQLQRPFRATKLVILPLKNEDINFLEVRGLRVGDDDQLAVNSIPASFFSIYCFPCIIECKTGAVGTSITLGLRNNSPESIPLAIWLEGKTIL